MHERRLVADLVHHIDEVANANGDVAIERVKIEIGALSHATPESLRSAMEPAIADKTWHHAALDITKATDVSSPDALDVRLVSISVEDT
jgi:Zn finger protein HypA/HybF involved in hydrogenase expression